MGMLFLHTKLALGHWQTRSTLGRRLLGTCHVVFNCIGLEIAGRSHACELIALANALAALANALGAVLPWE